MNIMIKPVSGHCNADCEYCFYKKSHVTGSFMSLDTMNTVIDRLSFFLRGGYSLVFQGGEPLLAGYDFFKKTFDLLDARSLQPQILIQTNGSLLNDAFAKLFAEHNVLVGVSLDGTEAIHNAYRSDFASVMAGINCLRRQNCEFNVLTVVTDNLCLHLPEIYEFYRRENFLYQQYIPCLAPVGADPYLFLSEKNYGHFLKELYALWRRDLTDGRYVYIRYFENLLQLLAGFLPEECGAQGICSPQLLVESDGNVYPCDFFVQERYRLGSLKTAGLEALWKQLEETNFISSSRSLPSQCHSCRFLNLCRGGCRRYRSRDGRFLYCHAVSDFLIYALPDMEQLLNYVVYSLQQKN